MANHFATALVLVAALLTGCAGADTSAPQDSGDGVSACCPSAPTRSRMPLTCDAGVDTHGAS